MGQHLGMGEKRRSRNPQNLGPISLKMQIEAISNDEPISDQNL
ncbi:MAG: hypothetical protein O4859_31415 [Trichodesmium sp. St18_bin1]|nr:hypothetical protein [Trichodesmium sp. St18_bin1]MDE5124290.1 hypothetical protein [Trichodesmium sp. St19_bin1]